MGSVKSQLNKNIQTMEEGAVTLLDILGWKGIWQRKPKAMESLKGLKELVKDLQEQEVDQNKKFSGLEPKIWGLSDTIVLTTYGKSQAVLPLHILMTEYLLSFCLTENMPARGAIGYGQFSSIDNMLVGPAVDEVASWYEAVEWVGAILTPTASFHYCENYSADGVLEYSVVLKKGGKYLMKCVDWFDSYKNEAELLQSFLDTSGIITPEVAPKYINTLEFFRHIHKLKQNKKK